MKAVSLWQPWASAIALGLKTIETRGWYTAYRGPLAIHAAKRWTMDQRAFFMRYCTTGWPDPLPLGSIVAVCVLQDCRPTRDLIVDATQQDREWGNFDTGRYGWVLTDVVRLEKPIPYRGAQQLFDVPDSLIFPDAVRVDCRDGRLL